MHIPRDPPDTDSVLNDRKELEDFRSREIKRYAREFNRRYLHWSEVRLRDTGRFRPDTVWYLMKLYRMGNSVELRFGRTDYTYVVSDRILTLLYEFDTRLSSASQDPRDRNGRTYCFSDSVMEESIASSQMEGAVTTTKKAKEMLRLNIRPRNRSEHMIVNNYRAMLFIKEHLSEPLTLELIRDIHSIVTDGTLDRGCVGRFRDNDDVVVQDAITGEVFHRPVPFRDIGISLSQLCDFVNSDSTTHPIIKGIILHYAVAYIHPFEDGNGRVARSLFYWYTMRSGYRSVEYLALSRYIKSHKGRYGEAYLFGETDDNDMTYFILFNLQALISSVSDFEDYLRKKTEEDSVQNIPGLNERQTEIIYGMGEGGRTTVRSVQNQFGVSLNTARADIRTLLDLGLIRESGKDVNMKVYIRTDKRP